MATSFVISCPECEKQINAREDLIGKKIRCKSCEHVFVVKMPKNLAKGPADDEEEKPKKAKPKKEEQPANTKKPEEEEGATFKLKDEPKETKPAAPPKKPGLDDDEDDPNPYTISKDNDFVPRCPYCTHELESENIVICKECGYNMVTRRRTEQKMVHEATSEEILQWRMPAYVCIALIIIALVVSILCFVKTKKWMEDSWFVDDEAKGDVNPYYVKPGCFQLGNVMLTAFLIFQLGKFIYKRLVVDNMPPSRTIEEGDAEAAAEAEKEMDEMEDD